MNELQEILSNSAVSAEQKARARAALGVGPDPEAMNEDTRKMLDTLKVKSIAGLSLEIYERYCLTHNPRPTDWIVREIYYWLPPDDSFLATIGMTVNDWWLQTRRLAQAANRADVEAYALRKLQGS